MLPTFDEKLHGNCGMFMGLPVFEVPEADEPFIISVPIPHTHKKRRKLIVPNWPRFEDQIWLEMTLHRIIRDTMGGTLEWLYGPYERRTWVSPSSRYSRLMTQIATIQSWDTILRGIKRTFVPTTESAFATADGRLTPLPIPGYTVTHVADVQDSSVYDVQLDRG